MWLELRMHLTLDLLQTKQLTSGDRCNEGRAVIETHVFETIYIFSPLDHREG